MEEVELIDKIKQKRELGGIDNSVVLDSLNSYIKKHNLLIPTLKKSEKKIIIKAVRAELRTLVGQFQKGKRNNISDYTELLKTHLSTSERLSFYPHLINLFKKLKIKSILDLGCGLNPLALADKKIKYFASDINSVELSIISGFFKKNKVDGETFVCDLRKIEAYELPETDITLIFKVLDIIENKGHKLAEKVLLSLKSKYALISFPTKKLSGKSMNFPRRLWFEKMLSRLSLKFETFKSDNEIFYLINNK